MPARPHVGDSIIDELNCLNLHITLPRGWTQDAALPIIMFIHGGEHLSTLSVFCISCSALTRHPSLIPDQAGSCLALLIIQFSTAARLRTG
jgi:hypothetical protein